MLNHPLSLSPINHHPKVDTVQGEEVCTNVLEREVWCDWWHVVLGWCSVVTCAAATPHILIPGQRTDCAALMDSLALHDELLEVF